MLGITRGQHWRITNRWFCYNNPPVSVSLYSILKCPAKKNMYNTLYLFFAFERLENATLPSAERPHYSNSCLPFSCWWEYREKHNKRTYSNKTAQKNHASWLNQTTTTHRYPFTFSAGRTLIDCSECWKIRFKIIYMTLMMVRTQRVFAFGDRNESEQRNVVVSSFCNLECWESGRSVFNLRTPLLKRKERIRTRQMRKILHETPTEKRNFSLFRPLQLYCIHPTRNVFLSLRRRSSVIQSQPPQALYCLIVIRRVWSGRYWYQIPFLRTWLNRSRWLMSSGPNHIARRFRFYVSADTTNKLEIYSFARIGILRKIM